MVPTVLRGFFEVVFCSMERWWGALDGVDVRLVHEPEELAGVGGERLDEPPLPFGIQGVERERRFPGAGYAFYDDKLVPRDRDADIFEVVWGIKDVKDGVSESELGNCFI